MWLAGFGVANAAGMLGTGWLLDAGALYYLGAASASAHLARQIATVNLDDPDDCMETFKSNKWFGALFFAGILADKTLTL